ncbi:putative PurR-regulated permease PerM [Chitinophaga skermanii]|uniref:Putative PurR-regulated permease PerM n=1 Tax=Chitinophaga skermanii TaxID=331697 RepID=A0A327Q0A7_9BACT|nr:AI-2E family transporter [Chitinophaga skermanii]RAI97880.1 putative PurR-regulated permease PerM [Chitinophaga skermanii]
MENTSTLKQPFYVKLAAILFVLIALVFIIYMGQEIFVPFAFSFLIAVLLRPIEKKLTGWGLHRVLAIFITIILAAFVLFGVLTFLSYQFMSFFDDWPKIERNLLLFGKEIQDWLRKTFDVSVAQQQQVLERARSNSMEQLGAATKGTLGALGGSLAMMTLIPIYVFLFMFYRTLLLQFIIDVFDKKHEPRVREVIGEVRVVVQSYISGLLLETACVAVLNCIGLLLLGVPYAILLGVISALLNLIPYIGGLVAVVLSALIALTNTGDIGITIGVIGVFLVVQFIDNNLLVPRIIGSKVKLNALFSIVAVLVGGAICGIAGMFLSIPFLAIFKVIFDRVEELKPYGRVLGDEEQMEKKKRTYTKRKTGNES